MKNCKQIATEWGLSERTVNDLCKKNKIDGAIKVGKMWKIPDDAKKPIDGRITSGKYVRHSAGVTRKPLPIGISDYVRAQADYYYVDKTMLIKEFLDQKPLVSLFTRPRRFGKTLNMDMLRVFFEISEENTSKYFEDKAIWQCGEEYRNQQGQYPVVFLTFKDVKFDSWKATLDKIRDTRVRFCHTCYRLEQSQERQPIRLQKVSMRMIIRTCRKQLLNIWINQSASMMPEQRVSIMD